MGNAAWEQTERLRQRMLVGILVPQDAKVSIAMHKAMANLQLPPGSDYYFIDGFPYGPGRNLALKAALDGGHGYLAFLDSDVVVLPDTFLRLRDTNLPFVSGLYRRRRAPFTWAAGMAEEVDEGPEGNRVHKVYMKDIPAFTPGAIIPVDFVPAGMSLIRRDIVALMLKSFPRPYEFTVDYNTPPGEGFSEDYAFSWRLKGLGIQPYIHTGVLGKHEMLARVTPEGMVEGTSW